MALREALMEQVSTSPDYIPQLQAQLRRFVTEHTRQNAPYGVASLQQPSATTRKAITDSGRPIVYSDGFTLSFRIFPQDLNAIVHFLSEVPMQVAPYQNRGMQGVLDGMIRHQRRRTQTALQRLHQVTQTRRADKTKVLRAWHERQFLPNALAQAQSEILYGPMTRMRSKRARDLQHLADRLAESHREYARLRAPPRTRGRVQDALAVRPAPYSSFRARMLQDTERLIANTH